MRWRKEGSQVYLLIARKCAEYEVEGGSGTFFNKKANRLSFFMWFRITLEVWTAIVQIAVQSLSVSGMTMIVVIASSF